MRPAGDFIYSKHTEKALKAWIAVLEHDYPRTHDLALLCRLIMDFGGDTRRYQSLVSFTPFGTRLRYEDEFDSLNLIRTDWNKLCTDSTRACCCSDPLSGVIQPP